MSANIARHLERMAGAHPGRPAIRIPRGRGSDGSIDYLSLDFAELAAEAAGWAEALRAKGVAPGDRTLVMVRPGLPLIASIFGIFQFGAVPVVIDPGMGLKSFLRCVERSRPSALVGVPRARLASRIFRRAFRTVRRRIPASASLTARIADAGRVTAGWHEPNAEDLAAILFTSGSTGAPKGVCYEHGMLAAQVEAVRTTYGIEPGEIDFPLLPVFALFNPALGMTTIVPELDPRRPASIDAAAAVQAIRQEGVTNSFGSPTLWSRIAEHCIHNRIELPSLKRVLCAGAPVPASLWAGAKLWLTKGVLQSPYGATEALPISSVTASEIDVQSTDGACVGRPVAGVDVRLIEVREGPIANLAGARPPADGVGEIVVRGPMVTATYDGLPEATTEAKIADADKPGARPWHRMGDCGRIDRNGRLWFLGRKVERVQTNSGTLHTEPCEQVFRRHPGVRRCALIGIGSAPTRTPAMVIEPAAKLAPGARDELFSELAELGGRFPHTAGIRIFFLHPAFPVDVRHNAKIHRLALARWARTASPHIVR